LAETPTDEGGTLYLQAIFCTGYCFSLLSLLIALLIFQHFRGPTSNLVEVGDYVDFEDPLVVSLIKATSYPVHLPLHLELLRYLALSDGAKIVQVHDEIVAWHRSPLDPFFPFSSYSGCTCGRIDEPCRCSIQLIRSPVPPFKSLDPKVYHPLIRFKRCYANFNFDITFIPTQRIAVVSGFLDGSLKKSAPGMWVGRVAVFQRVSFYTEGVRSLCAADQSLVENRPQISLCLTTFGFRHTRLNTLSVFSWCANGTILYLYNATTSIQAWASLAMLCWMFVEGAYLLNIVYWTFRLHQVRIWHYALFGWGVPAVFISIWTTIHAVTHPNIRWIEQSQDFYLISLPSLIILSVSWSS
uniref:G_PROTEIN_RECEP_F2_4 domain-containing protein n=1 Tax=Taenia asiatica TaxID=60517 RepID=A0A0R3VYH6_TAEAS